MAPAFKTVPWATTTTSPTGTACAGDLAAAGLAPALRSYGAEPERWRPRAKDWNQDLQGQVNAELNQNVGLRRVTDATVADLETRLAQAEH